MSAILRIILFDLLLFSFSVHAHEALILPSAIQPSSGPIVEYRQIAPEDPTCSLSLQVISPHTDQATTALVRIFSADGKLLPLKDLLPRSAHIREKEMGTPAYQHFNSWSVIPGHTVCQVPQETLHIEAFQGLETRLTMTEVDCSALKEKEIVIRLDLLPEIFPRVRNYHGNVHLHFKGLSMAQAEQYATQVSPADGLDLVFFSYLNRAGVDQEYISNYFTHDDLRRFTESSGTLFGYGEEYRHNFPKQPDGTELDGYGHVMFLDFVPLILPASFGPALMKEGFDDGTLQAVIQQAHDLGATALWCHNQMGWEDIPNWLGGHLDAQVIFDQGSKGTYADTFYRYMNVGLKVPFATGTDWFLRDMAQTIVTIKEPLSTSRWLEGLRKGHSSITNGPLLHLSIGDATPGSTISIEQPTTLKVIGKAIGRCDFGSIELILNGEVVHQKTAQQIEGCHAAMFEYPLKVDRPAWIALRIPPFDGGYDRPETLPVHFNEYGKPLFAHTSAIMINYQGKGVFHTEAATSLLSDLHTAQDTVRQFGVFSSDSERAKTLEVYESAIQTLETKLKDK